MEDAIKAKANQMYDRGDLSELQEMLAPYIAIDDPYALYLSATFSNAESKESDQEYAERYIRYMKKASEGGVAQASYQMGVNYLYGDDVAQDYKAASMYFERAILQGHSYAKSTYGFSLYYGTDQIPKDQKRGLALIQEAANEGIDKAKNELELINASKNV